MSILNAPSMNTMPVKIVLDYLELYKMIGRGENVISELDVSYNKYHIETVNEDIFYLYRMVFKDAKITDTRLKQFIERKGNINPKNKEEIFAYNLRNIFDKIELNNNFIMDTGEFIDLSRLLYNGIYAENNSIKKMTSEMNYREELDNLLGTFRLLNESKTEYIYKCTAFLVDFLKLSPFKYGNDLIGYLAFYCLIHDSDIKALRYDSFFKALIEKEEDFKKAINKGFYLYDEGLSDIFDLHKIVVDILIKSYKEIDFILKNTYFDKQISKSNNVIGAIYKLGEVFTKDEVMKLCPTVSKTTVDRTLKQLSEECKIQAFGTGRGAKWVRLDNSQESEIDNYLKN